MNATFNSNENFNELVFENRNKQYGAYVLRKAQNNNMTVALFLASVFFGTLVIVAVKWNAGNLIPKMNGSPLQLWDTASISITPDEKLDDVVKKKDDVAPPDKPKLFSDNINPEVVDRKVNDSIKGNDLAVINPGGNEKGTDSVASGPVKTEGPTGNGGGEKKEEAIFIAHKMPDFEGGITRYVSSHLNYPSIAVENNTEGTVHLSFIIEKDGSVSNVKVLRGIGDGCEQEAARVIKGMPKWIAGKDEQGLPRRVVLNLPVKFRIK
ncbi:MAG: energy transducer TonB [Bacteroidota bacterium]|nr:energy transducer TonB [Bacteroidota bacterium]